MLKVARSNGQKEHKSLQHSMPSGCRLIFLTFLSRQSNHSDDVKVGIHVTRVGGNRSSWNSSFYTNEKNTTIIENSRFSGKILRWICREIEYSGHFLISLCNK